MSVTFGVMTLMARGKFKPSVENDDGDVIRCQHEGPEVVVLLNLRSE